MHALPLNLLLFTRSCLEELSLPITPTFHQRPSERGRARSAGLRCSREPEEAEGFLSPADRNRAYRVHEYRRSGEHRGRDAEEVRSVPRNRDSAGPFAVHLFGKTNDGIGLLDWSFS